MDASYQLLAARYVRKQLKQLTGQLDGIRRGEDTEFVHRARVASRRLRAALRMFDECFGRKPVKRWRKEIRRLTGNLGEARDKDVQIEFIRGVLSRLSQDTHYPGIARLLVNLEHQRERLQPKVLDTVERWQTSPVPVEMRETTHSLIRKLDQRGIQVRSEFVLRRTEKHILTRLAKFVGHQNCLADAEDHGSHHAMRIAAKQLRYTMEICKPVHDNRLDKFVDTVKEVQSLLGEIHDCDVWGEDLDVLLKKERRRVVKYFHHSGPLARLRTGIDHLREERARQRRRLFDKLVQYWKEVDRTGLWDDLIAMVRSQNALSEVSESDALSSSDTSSSSDTLSESEGSLHPRSLEPPSSTSWDKPVDKSGFDKPRPVSTSLSEPSIEETN